jgi:radical SAM protein with 4Fe4S-binding SPASM domain
MVVNKWNYHEIDEFDAFARDHGADSAALVGLCALTPEGWHMHEEWACGDPKFSSLAVGNVASCEAPNGRLSFNWNGDVYNCCNPVGLERYKLGNIVEAAGLDEIWTSPKMEYIRRFCKTGKPEHVPFDIPCYRCFGAFPSEERKKSDEYCSCFAKMEKKNG